MRRIGAYAAVAAAVLGGWACGAATGEEAGAAGGFGLGDAPPLAGVEMEGVDGARRTIAGVAGEKGTLVVFTCNACPWVRKWEGRIAEIGNEAREEGIGVIAINSNDPEQVPQDGMEEMRRRAEALGLEFPYVVDATSDVARAFGATRTPEVFLFDAANRLVYRGAVDDDANDPAAVEAHHLRDAIAAVLAGTEVPVRETRALGCSIKFR